MNYRFIWHDGGRSAAGFTGYAGDCGARAMAIATGEDYKTIYNEITERQGQSPRKGTSKSAIEGLLKSRGWKQEESPNLPADKGVLIVDLCDRTGHLCTVVDGVLYDTWDALSSKETEIIAYWWHPQYADPDHRSLPKITVRCKQRAKHDAEFQRVLDRLKKLDATASNAAATEGEVENAIRAMQAILLKHNLTREDITDGESSGIEGFTNRAVPVNGKNACAWENYLAMYVCEHLFPLVNCYRSSRGRKQTLFWFYGPLDDVEQCIELYRELLLTIAVAAQSQFGNFRRGSGASYAEGFVSGLPREPNENEAVDASSSSAWQLVKSRSHEITLQAQDWLHQECGVKLRSTYGYGRSAFDRTAYARGQADGAKHHLGDRKRRQITHRR